MAGHPRPPIWGVCTESRRPGRLTVTPRTRRTTRAVGTAEGRRAVDRDASSRPCSVVRAKQTEVWRVACSGTPTAVEVERRRTHGSDGFTDVTGDVNEVLQYECRFADVTGDVDEDRKVTSAVVQIALPQSTTGS